MALLAPTMSLSTPLLKVLLLLGHVVCTYHGMSPPKSPANATELKRIGSTPDFLSKSRFPSFLRACSATAKLILCGIALTEAAIILAQQYPSPLSARLLAFPLAPQAGGAPSVRLTAVSAAACALAIAGGALRGWCHRTLGRFFTWEVAVRDGHELITRGPYALVRHPSYTGWVLLMAGNFLLLASPGSYYAEGGLWTRPAGKALAGALVGYLGWVTTHLIRRTASEDAILRKEFGKRWDEWAGRTPYRLIPFVY